MRTFIPLDPERVRALLDYDPITGDFTWFRRPDTGHRSRIWNTRFAGKPAGCLSQSTGYWAIRLDDRHCHGHRLAWVHFYGANPSGLVDHIDRNRSNNRIANLRIVDDHQSMWNRTANKGTVSGRKGVTWHKKNKMWTARVFHRGESIYLGSFADADDAAAAYMAAARELFGQYATTGEHASQ